MIAKLIKKLCIFLAAVLLAPASLLFAVEPQFGNGLNFYSDSSPFLGIYSQFGRWEDGSLKLAYNPALAPADATLSLVEDNLTRAIEILEGIADVNIDYLGVSNLVSDEFTDGIVAISWQDLGENNPGTSRPSFGNPEYTSASSPLYTDGEIVMNTVFGEYPASLRYFTHQLLHLLGLGHSNNPVSIMSFKYYGFRYPQQDDIDALQSLYGPPDEFVIPSDGEKLSTDNLRPGLASTSDPMSLYSTIDQQVIVFDGLRRINFISDQGVLSDLIWVRVDYTGALIGETLDLYTINPDGYSELVRQYPITASEGSRIIYAGQRDDFLLIPGLWQFKVAIDTGLLSTLDVQVIGDGFNYTDNPDPALELLSDGNGSYEINVSIPDPMQEEFAFNWWIPENSAIAADKRSASVVVTNSPIQVFIELDRINEFSDDPLQSGFAGLLSRYLFNPPKQNTPVFYVDSGLLHLPSVQLGRDVYSMNFKLTEIGGVVFKLLEFDPVETPVNGASSVLDPAIQSLRIPSISIVNENGDISEIENLEWFIDVTALPPTIVLQ